GKRALVQTDYTQGLEKFVDQARVWSTTGDASSNPTNTHGLSANLKQQVHDAFWSTMVAASSNPTDTDSVLSNLRQQVQHAFADNGCHASNAADDLAAFLHFTHHE